jgi:PAS domain S-box-containing protein
MQSETETVPLNPATGILGNLPFGVVTLDGRDVIETINSSALEMFGYSEGELAGKLLTTIVEREEKALPDNYVANRLVKSAGGGEVFRDGVGHHKDGSHFAAELTLSPLDTGKCLAIIRNIDAEIERENRYRILFETSDYPQLIIINNKFEFANQAAVDAFGCDSIEDLKSIHPSIISPEMQPDGRDSYSKAEEMMSIAYEKGGHRFDWMHRKKNGAEMLMDVILTRMPHMGSDALFCGYRDISEREQREEMLRRTQKLDAIGQLTGGIAHDFNNLLGIIQGNLEVLQRTFPDSEFAQGRIQSALVGTTRGADLTRKLLAFSREEASDTKRIDVNQSIVEFESLIGKSLTASVKIDLKLAENIWPVEVDAADFENVILNLALNARDAMPDGGTLTIETSHQTLDDAFVRSNPGARAGEFVLVAVSDTGAGMAPEVRDKVFEPFFTTKDEGKGTGLGLSMVYGFIKQSGGHVKVYSEPGVGTTIHIYLPRSTSGGESDEIVEDRQADLPRGTETVLLVDDEEGLLEVSQVQLEDLGYTVVVARSGAQALEALAERPDIDLLFSDVVMPGGSDGFKLALQAMAQYPGLKVQLTSGFTRQLEARADGNEDVINQLSKSLLRKPYNQRDLAHSVRAALDSETA